MKELLSLSEPPTAVFAVSDRAALGAMEAIKEAGLRVPEDISVVGFDDAVDAEHSAPPLTTIHYARAQMGVLALATLLEMMEGKRDRPTRTCIHTELVVRSSTAPLSIADKRGGGQ
jgi:DNA-binding LacI/PurR family transcriptional regulator